jgi:ElaB/YqjD/DUF883 family membrane-anchored ribosome-binding protein
MPINPDDHTTWTLEQLLEHGSTAELEELLANTGPDALSRTEAEQVAAELERRRYAARRDVATARTALEIVQAMNAMVEATPWQPGDVELDDELELVAGAVHLLARRAVERRRELEENPLRHVGSAAAELAELRRRFGINVARLITEGTEL